MGLKFNEKQKLGWKILSSRNKTRILFDGGSRSGKTALIITHSLEEAFALCDRIIIARGAPFTVAADLKKSDFESLEAFKTAAEKFI